MPGDGEGNRPQESPWRPAGPLTPSRAPPFRAQVQPRIFQDSPRAAAGSMAESTGDSNYSETLIRPSAVQTPVRFRQPVEVQSAPPKMSKPTRSSARQLPPPPPSIQQQHRNNSNSSNNNSNIKNNNNNQRLRRIRNRKRRKNADFLVESYFPTMGLQMVSLTQRSAFERRPLVSMEEWERIAKGDLQRRQTNMRIRMSPSYQHLQLLHALQRIETLPQLQFAPSVGQDADIFHDWLTISNEPCSNVRDGRYRSIDPVKATRALLPTTAPILSSRKTRLPLRSDVGFPNATEDEIRMKQMEIQRETEWEQANPRLVFMVVSADVGTCTDYGNGDTKSPEHLEYNGGGLVEMPFAGRELLQAIERNARHFGKAPLPTVLSKFTEANPWSVLAPPLDATYSRSQGWRPRPYHDRPPGRQHILVCPQHLSLEVGDLEPLVCSLALYALPTSGVVDKKRPYGKISEEFWFRAGSWGSSQVIFEGARRDDGSVDEDVLEAWMRRKQKAVFSYDPLALVDGPESLVLVLQVHRFATCDESYIIPEERRAKIILQSTDQSLEQFGSQLLSPFCFGTVPLVNEPIESCDDDNNAFLQWPGGEIGQIPKIYAQPSRPESQEAFVSRLAKLVFRNESDSISSSDEIDEDTGNRSKTPSKQIASRLFKAKTGSNSADMARLLADNIYNGRPHEPSGSIKGSFGFFFSQLSRDFLQCMLFESECELDHANEVNSADILPKVFVDVTGDSAVLLDPSQSHAGNHDVHKRSSLLRLPFPREPSGYIATAEFREVLYLPPRPEKHYDVDSDISGSSPVNVLYLYPRLLRCDEKVKADRLTIRIRLIRSDSDEVVATKAFHNPVFWSGPPLLDEVFTKVHSGSGIDIRAGTCLRDEIKVRLPVVIDGRFSLDFALFALNEVPAGLDVQKLAAVAIPLSTSASRGSEMKERTATIIPNGNHRLKLGGFQLQLETRLISSIHVGDPGVALVLRDYPRQSLIHVPVLEQLKGSESFDTADNKAESMLSILSKASGASIVSQFDALLHIIASNLIRKEDYDEAHTEESTMHHFLCLFEVLRKAKEKFTGAGAYGKSQMKSFIKNQIDSFDERVLTRSSSCDKILDNEPEKAFHSYDPQDESENAEPGTDVEHEGTGRVKPRSRRLSNRYESHLSRMVDNLGMSSLPLSRVVYGAVNKMDQMLLESDNETKHFAYYFEDDETVFTNPSFQLPVDSESADGNIEYILSTMRSPQSAASENSIIRARSFSNADPSHLNGGQEFAQRVRTVAQVMLAPCGVSPSNFMPQPGASSTVTNEPFEIKETRIKESFSQKQDPNLVCFPGSDIDDSDFEFDKHSPNAVSSECDNVLRFSAGSLDGKEMPVTTGIYIYETIMMLWIRAWLDHIEALLLNDAEVSKGQVLTFSVLPWDPMLYANECIYSCFAHMDMLLPICLKSMYMRCKLEGLPVTHLSKSVIFDDSHKLLLDLFVEMLARGLVSQGLSNSGIQDDRDRALLKALASSQVVIDFLVGLTSILHPECMRLLLNKFMDTLRRCEIDDIYPEQAFKWTEERFHRIKCSRQLRLRVIEAFATLPAFLAFNFPAKYSPHQDHEKPNNMCWTHQEADFDKTTYLFSKSRLLPCEFCNQSPHSGWLADLLMSEALSICTLSCEVVVAEALAMTCTPGRTESPFKHSSTKNRPGAALKRDELLVMQSIAVHAITCVYELIIRRHAMDKRFQSEKSRERIAGTLAVLILDKSIADVKWLSRMDGAHKVRSIWLLCFIYSLQEAPEALISAYVKGLCDPNDFRIHRFVRLLWLSTITFQSLASQHHQTTSVLDIDNLSVWLWQESFNSICATTITIVDECGSLTANFPEEHERLLTGVLDLILYLLTTPQSPVTHLRAVGGALQALESFGIELFLETMGDNLQHWARVLLSLMNCTSLSVRSIAVDFVVSLMGSMFDYAGSIDELSVIFTTVLPEVSAREIASHGVNGLLSTSDDVARCLWSLRRSLADIEDNNPLDDDRIDAQLTPILSVFCRACQAILDSVLIELRLRGNDATIIGSKILQSLDFSFDADEESLYEAAMFFAPETAPMQRIRWLSSLMALHESKNHWVEAAECQVLRAKTIIESIPHLKNVWRASKFDLWSELSRSPWLGTVGENVGAPDRGYIQVMNFADEFLEPSSLKMSPASTFGRLRHPTLQGLSTLLIDIVNNALTLYDRCEESRELAIGKLESLIFLLVSTLDKCFTGNKDVRFSSAAARTRRMEDESALRNVLDSIYSALAKLTECKTIMKTCDSEHSASASQQAKLQHPNVRSQYVLFRLSGKKPCRFNESTGIPTFLEFDTSFICHLSETMNETVSAKKACIQFARPFLSALCKDCPAESVVLKVEAGDNETSLPSTNKDTTYLHVTPVEALDTDGLSQQSKIFFYRKAPTNEFEKPIVVELKVAQPLPGALSRQRVLVTTEILPRQVRAYP